MRILRTSLQRGLLLCVPLVAAAGIACGASNRKSIGTGLGGIMERGDAALMGGARARAICWHGYWGVFSTVLTLSDC
jgi:hypothetical protein